MSKSNVVKESAAEYASELFKAKHQFRRDLARLPIEEKMKILVELQKIVLKTKKGQPSEELRRVWEIF